MFVTLDPHRLDFPLCCQDHVWSLCLLTVEPSPPSARPSFTHWPGNEHRKSLFLDSWLTYFFFSFHVFLLLAPYRIHICLFHPRKEHTSENCPLVTKGPPPKKNSDVSPCYERNRVMFTSAWTGFIQGLLFYYSAKGFAGYSVWKSLRDDFFKEMFLSGTLESERLFFLFFFNSTPQLVKLPESTASFCERLRLGLCITRGNLQGWIAQLQSGISPLRLINNSPEKQTGIDFKGYTFIERKTGERGCGNARIPFWFRSTRHQAQKTFSLF